VAAAIGILLSLIFSGLLQTSSMGWQVVIAVIALAIGIPHGALDHLVTLPKAQPKKMAIFIVVYVAVAVVAVIGILQFNTIGFIIVLFMSAIHFGIGDAAFINEIDKRSDAERKLNRWFYIPAAGFTPVFIPLVNSASTQALASVNPALINWHQGYDSEILLTVTSFAVLAIVLMGLTKRNREVLDLTLLLLLAHFAPPLIAFAVYFGCWHAMRHTARLTLSLPRSIENLNQGMLRKAFSNAVIPGLPALIGTFVVAGFMALSGRDFSDQFFWMALVVVWALTVPHMVVTAKLDRAALT
jgi:Brp/Blh family beta-carotene 15,15'-monooxygenase